MDYDKFISIISSDVERILKENSENVVQNLFSGVESDRPCLSPDQLQIIRNAVNLSIQFSVQIIFDYLDSLGMLETKNLFEHYEPPVLKVIRGSYSDHEE